MDSVETSYRHKIENSGYVYEFLKVNKYNNEALIITNSDNIPYVEYIARESKCHFTLHLKLKCLQDYYN